MPDAERDLVSGVIQLANLLNRRLGPIFERAKVTPQQWSILSMLAESDAPMTLESANGRVRVTPGRHPSPDVVLSGPPDGIIGLLAGKRDRPAVAKVTVKGDARKIASLRPHPV